MRGYWKMYEEEKVGVTDTDTLLFTQSDMRLNQFKTRTKSRSN